MNKTGRIVEFVFLLVVSTMLISCGQKEVDTPANTQTFEVLSVNEEKTVKSEISQEKTFDQCESASPFKATIRFSQSEYQASHDELVISANISGEAGLSEVAKVQLGTAIEKHFSNTTSSTQGHDESVNIEVPAYTKQKYTIYWQEVKREGTVEYIENGSVHNVNYSYRIGVEFSSSSVSDLRCPQKEPTQVSPTSKPVATNTPNPTSTPRSTNTPDGSITETHTISGEESDTIDSDGIGASDKSWYSTGIYIQSGDKVSIQYLSGQWWIGKAGDGEWVEQDPTDANGYTGRDSDRVIAQMAADNPDICQELSSAPIGSLIGRIEKNGAFYVGNDLEFTASETGILFLRINYNSRIKYVFNYAGECPPTNGGQITVRVSVIP